MNVSSRIRAMAAIAGLALSLAACSHKTQEPAAAASPAASPARASVPAAADSVARAATFTPPPMGSIPDTPFGDMVRLGRNIFVHTDKYAGKYVGNGLVCANCHLDAGRLAGSAPLWAARVTYPTYRKKDGKVVTYSERLQGCFRYSMNGKAPPLGGRVLVALDAYSFWLAKGAPTGVVLPGAGYPGKHAKPPQPPSYARGEKVYKANCELCHGDDGQGRKVAGKYVFPPLWGPDSFNWGAGMHELNVAAAFIKANMPLGRGGMLDEQQAWDVAMFMDAHERPQDPRYNGNLAETRKKYHDTPMSLYGTVVNGHLLGSKPSR